MSKTKTVRRQKARIRRGGKSACFVYGLRSETGAIVYVGQTRCALDVRMKYHLKAASRSGSPIQRWMADNKAEIVMLVSSAVWDVDEILTIERLRLRGEPLLNVLRGGNDRRK